MQNRNDEIKKMYEEGMKYEDIGNHFGITKQRVYQIVHKSMPGDGFRKESVKRVKYVGLRNWMIKNRVSILKLCRMTGKANLYSNLLGPTDVQKSSIDAILSVTGLTYEECFGKED